MKIESKRILYATVFPLGFLLILWLIQVVEWGLDSGTIFPGIYPRAAKGLPGIFCSALAHANFSHLFSNTLPLLILGWCLCYFYTSIAYRSFFLLWFTSSALTWIIGREAWHIGASGIVYALSFFLFISGILRRYIPLIAVSLLVAFLYGSTVWNMSPLAELVERSTSWEGHLSGALAGMFWAVIFRNIGPQKPPTLHEEEEEEEEETEENTETPIP